MKPLWDFHCTAGRLQNGHYHVRIETKSGRVIERTGYDPMHELIRILGKDAKTENRSIHDFDDFALDMVNIKAAELVGKAGFTADDLEDIRQDMLLDLIERLAKYDPSKSSFKLFVTYVIDRKGQNMIRRDEEAKQS
jgi:hypothetical protein